MSSEQTVIEAPKNNLQTALQASVRHAPADDLLVSLQTHAGDFQAELIQSILDQTHGHGYDRKTHLAGLLPLRRGMEVIGEGSAVDVRNTILIVNQLKALVWATAAMSKSTNPLERACYDWRYHMELVTAFNAETSILQSQLAHQQRTRAH